MADTQHKINCPACNKEMHKIFIPKLGIKLDICLDGCGGIYFDNKEFQEFDEYSENIDEITEALANKTFVKVDEDLPRVCPVCGAKMVKNYTSPKKLVQIDECYSCGGKFLDYGELEKIRDEYPTEDDRRNAVMTELYNTVGQEIKELDEHNKLLASQRSIFKKMFDKLIYG